MIIEITKKHLANSVQAYLYALHNHIPFNRREHCLITCAVKEWTGPGHEVSTGPNSITIDGNDAELPEEVQGLVRWFDNACMKGKLPNMVSIMDFAEKLPMKVEIPGF